MINAKTSPKQLCRRFTSVLLLLSLATSSSAEEIQPVRQIKEFINLPQLPKIEPIRVPDPIKPFNPLPAEVDRSKLISVQTINFDKSQLVGDWKSTQPFIAKYIGGATTIEGIIFTVLPDSSLKKEWTSEGVMYESTTKDGTRRFASSFNYKTSNNLVLLMITFSANDLKNGVVIPFEIIGLSTNSDKARILKLKNENSVIELIEDKSPGKFTFSTENKTDVNITANEKK